MNKYQKEITKSILSEEEAVLKKLRGIYKKALDDIDSNIASLMGREDEENLQTIIYQTQYQKALKQQINGILDDLNTQQFNSISDYLAKSYEEGFSGVLYDLNKQGIPLTLPIDQKQVVYALQNDSKLSKPLYDSLGEDIDLLKKRIQNNISRGIATGSSYADIAKNIASCMVGDYSKMRGGALGKAYTITRTEGHRIQQKASEDARQEAKNHGADIVKQWDSTLDGRTRPTHVDLDGQIKELDEPFTNGLMYAGDPSGSAGEVINCRCVILQIPRWAIDDGFTKYDSFTKEQRDFADPKDYDEFKSWYFSDDNTKYMKYVSDLENKYGTKKFDDLLNMMTDKEYEKFHLLESNSPLLDASKRSKYVDAKKNVSYNGNVNLKKSVKIPDDCEFLLKADTNFENKDVSEDVLRIINDSIAKRTLVKNDFTFDEIKIARFQEHDKSVFVTNYESFGGKTKIQLYLNKKYFEGVSIEEINQMCADYYEGDWWKSKTLADLVNHEIMHSRIAYNNSFEKAEAIYDSLKDDDRVYGFCRLVDRYPEEFLNEVYVAICNGEVIDEKYIRVYEEYLKWYLG